MDYDLLVRRGRVVDGSGLPSFIADMGVKDGKIAEVGKLKGTAARTIGGRIGGHAFCGPAMRRIWRSSIRTL